jgi:ribonuclease H2 subunit A
MEKELSGLKCDFEKDEIILGIDEAGRGPVLGPMVYACCYYSENNENQLKKYFKFADSKQLKESVREEIFDKMEKTQHLIR